MNSFVYLILKIFFRSNSQMIMKLFFLFLLLSTDLVFAQDFNAGLRFGFDGSQEIGRAHV
jgi:hypothetical protein